MFVYNVQKAFDIERDGHSEEAILAEMGRFYRSHKHKMHKHFLKFKTKEEALEHRPEGVKEEEWPILCDHFSSAEYIVSF